MQPIFEKNANRTPQRPPQKKRPPPHIPHEKHKAPKVAERRRTLSRGEVRKDENPCIPAPLRPLPNKMRLPRCDSPTAPPRLKDATSRKRPPRQASSCRGLRPADQTDAKHSGLRDADHDKKDNKSARTGETIRCCKSYGTNLHPLVDFHYYLIKELF